ncbi:MAG TPA: ABC transporter permease [Chloroflexota bacterium]|jgi:peptide/nickel transport system permease protein|nr:ABC transporter permease [Chloroflexota bacterium]
MLAYIIRRLAAMIPTLIIASMLIFAIIRLPPADFVTTLVAQAAQSGSSSDQASMAALRHQYGLDQPLYVQYLRWIGGLLHGDLGYSFEWQRPVGPLIQAQLLYTVLLSLASMVFMWVIALPIGIYSATHQYSLLDHLLTLIGFLGLSVPDFMLGLIYLFISAFYFHQPVGGLFSPGMESAPWSLAKALDLFNHLIWPTIILGLGGTAQLIRIMRANLLDILGQQFITTARAKGLREAVVINKYAVRVAINPLISVMGMQIPNLISGATILGIVLSIPTVGPLLLRALIDVDMYLAGSILLFAVILLMVGNLIADICLAWVDPRIRYE